MHSKLFRVFWHSHQFSLGGMVESCTPFRCWLDARFQSPGHTPGPPDPSDHLTPWGELYHLCDSRLLNLFLLVTSAVTGYVTAGCWTCFCWLRLLSPVMWQQVVEVVSAGYICCHRLCDGRLLKLFLLVTSAVTGYVTAGCWSCFCWLRLLSPVMWQQVVEVVSAGYVCCHRLCDSRLLNLFLLVTSAVTGSSARQAGDGRQRESWQKWTTSSPWVSCRTSLCPPFLLAFVTEMDSFISVGVVPHQSLSSFSSCFCDTHLLVSVASVFQKMSGTRRQKQLDGSEPKGR